MSTILKVSSLNTYYGKSIHAVKNVNLEVEQGQIITLIGSNGAGKSTTLFSIAGILPVSKGSIIEYNGQNITGKSPAEIVRLGISLVPEGHEVFPDLTVKDNLLLGAYTCKDKKDIEDSFDRVYELFPILKERSEQMSGTLSGGEQQMLSIGRALMFKPNLMMLDEPSLGLAPNIVQMIFKMIKIINNQGVTILLVEQNAKIAFNTARFGYILETGKIQLKGSCKDLMINDKVKKMYLGL